MAKKELKTSEAQRRAMVKYQQKFIHVTINMDRELRQKMAAYCEKHGTSLSAIINEHCAMLVVQDMLEAEEDAENAEES